MSDLITYQYPTPSTLLKVGELDELLLSKFSETDKKESPCFFWGRIADPFSTARCLVSLSNVVQSSFNLSPAEIAKMKDPIITAGNNTIRFEGFSQCAGVYVRVDILPGGHDGEFLESGTTNVDFNQSMISALNQVARNEQLVMGIGQKEFSIANKVGLKAWLAKAILSRAAIQASGTSSIKDSRAAPSPENPRQASREIVKLNRTCPK